MFLKKFFACLKFVQTVVEYVIAPPICYVCKKDMKHRSILCSVCDRQIIPVAPKQFKINSAYTMSVHAIARYDEPLKKLVLAKHRSDHVLLEGLGQLMWEKTALPYIVVDCFVPIPLHWTRRFKRGFNQAELLAQALSKKSQAPVFNILNRVKKTQYQARLEKEDRNVNVKNAFELKNYPESLQGKHVMLVDDLCTTGSTAIEAAKVIAKQKPASISLIVACRAL